MKYITDQSIYMPIGKDKEGTDIIIEDILEDITSDFALNYETKVIYEEIREIVCNLPIRDREIIILYFGFFDNHPYTQQEIARKLNISKAYVSLLIIKQVKKIGIELKNRGVIDNPTKSLNKKPAKTITKTL